MRIQGSVVVISGASSGIGAATARELARQGATVVLAARREAELGALATEIERHGGRALAIPTDVSLRDDIERVVRMTIEHYGRIDVLINNAGMGPGSSVLNTDDAAMQQILNVNLLAPARCIQAVLPHMRQQQQGVILNIGSVAGEIATDTVYSATKFGLRGLTDALRRELRQEKIAVILVAPGFIRTSMTAGVDLPMPGPEAVARAIVAAIRRPRRKIIVPWPYVPLVAAAKCLPSFTDWLLGSKLKK